MGAGPLGSQHVRREAWPFHSSFKKFVALFHLRRSDVVELDLEGESDFPALSNHRRLHWQFQCNYRLQYSG